MLQQTPSRSEQALLFARNFFKHPRMLGSVIPSSRFLIKEITKRIDWKRARVIVEYGPGVGTITTEVLRRLRPDGKMIVFETNGEFVRFMRESLRDSRLHVVHGSAEDVEDVLMQMGIESVDYVITGIPFTTLPDPVRRKILDKTHRMLHRDGQLLVYQFTPTVLPYLKEEFGEVRRGFEPLNILPAWLFFCRPSRKRKRTSAA